jgi:hypothetical protein
MNDPPSTDEPASQEDRAAQPNGADAADPLVGQMVMNIFHEKVFIDRADMGISGVSTKRSRTGPLLDSEVNDALRHYLRPDPFTEALERLRTRGVVILCGPNAIGKRAGAFALLSACDVVRPLIGLSPSLTVDELNRHSFHRQHGYVVQDRTHSQDSKGTIDYELDELSRTLVRAGASLVITTSAMAASVGRDLMIAWSSPRPLDLVQRCYDDLGVPAASGQLGERIAERFVHCRTPVEIVDFISSLVSNASKADVGLRLLEQTDADVVEKWFNEEHNEEDILLIAALSFLHNVPEPIFERALADLEDKMQKEDEGDDEPGAQERSSPGRLVQKRRIRLRNVSLVTLGGGAGNRADTRGERRLVFVSGGHRKYTISELWNRYDHNLWRPISLWLFQLVLEADTDCALEIGLGIALLARVAPEEVERTYLGSWADGQRREREIACYVLWYASLDDTLSPWALEIAIRWARSSSNRARETAIVCLSGELGLRYPGEALRWLWHLSNRSTPQRPTAQRAFAELCISSVTRGDGDISGFRFLAAKLDSAKDKGIRSGKYSLALDIVDKLLIGRASGGEPALSILIAKRSEVVGTIGSLWARALISRTHRGTAIRALRDTLLNLNEIEGGLQSTRALGVAILALLPIHEVSLLERDLYRQLSTGNSGDQLQARSIVSALLTTSESHLEKEGVNEFISRH